MDRVWVWQQLAVTMRRVDFLDPADAGGLDVRERGVRVEVRAVRRQAEGSVYASDVTTLDQALCRLDFLESAPGRADRTHWHPEMSGREPGDRGFDSDMPSDPRGWLEQFLTTGLRDHLSRRHDDVLTYGKDLDEIGAMTPEIGRQLDEGLAWARRPWPDVEHDARGMADAS